VLPNDADFCNVCVMDIAPGFWNCCTNKPEKAVAFDGDRGGELIWHYACTSCASSVHPSRVMIPIGRCREVNGLHWRNKQLCVDWQPIALAGSMGELMGAHKGCPVHTEGKFDAKCTCGGIESLKCDCNAPTTPGMWLHKDDCPLVD
jgi:hypothetical protein